MSKLFSAYNFSDKSLSLDNRLVVAPMCQYSAKEGLATDWHQYHWTNLLNSGAGLVILEATAICPEGRISPNCLGIWDDARGDEITLRLDKARKNAPPQVKVGIQLSHAGRKASSAIPWEGGALLSPDNGGWETVAPSAVPHSEEEAVPRELDHAGIELLKQQFLLGAQRAISAGIEVIELHAAHGYLLHEFLSPLSNKRNDNYGGSFANRIRLVMEIFSSIRQIHAGVLGIRLSGSDWVEGGWDIRETAELAKKLEAEGCDYIHVSSGGLSPAQQIKPKKGYQLHLARFVKERVKIPVIAVGLLHDPKIAENTLLNGDADLVALARGFLLDPRWGWHAAENLDGKIHAVPQYWRSLSAQSAQIFHESMVKQR